MTLIKCPECGRALSDQAAACPQCAYPLNQTPHSRRPLYVTEKTGKTWKQLRAFGWLLVSVGVLVLFASWAGDHSRGEAAASLASLAGAACLWGSRLGAWWFHG